VSEDRVVIQGRASRRLAPDRARWTIAVAEQGERPREVFEACAARLARLLEALRAQAAPGEELATGAVTLHPDWTEPGDRVVRARAAVVTACAPERAAAFAEAAMQAGADELEGPWMTLAGADALRDELLVEAVGHARRSAERVAAAAGRALGRVVAIEEGELPGGIRLAGGGRLPVEPEEQELQVEVAVTFALG
jgi:uncharacterized protein